MAVFCSGPLISAAVSFAPAGMLIVYPVTDCSLPVYPFVACLPVIVTVRSAGVIFSVPAAVVTR